MDKDIALEAIAAKNPVLMARAYLTLSYLYYRRDIALVPDSSFDALCKALDDDDVFAVVAKDQHGRLIKRAALAAGTGYSLRWFPNRVISAAEHLAAKAGLA
ncbi:MAG: hypothetical protein GY882_13035 [Actinomycetia bacterium]|nr:hypothetical protein [Actinomycetes bacterium]